MSCEVLQQGRLAGPWPADDDERTHLWLSSDLTYDLRDLPWRAAPFSSSPIGLGQVQRTDG
jgi:hypothetical protein